MKIAKMDKRLELFKPILSDDGFGGMVTEYKSQGSVWAELRRTNYAEQEAHGTPMSREQLRFRLRPRKDIKRGWLVTYCDEKYVVDVVDESYRDSTTIIVRRYEQGV